MTMRVFLLTIGLVLPAGVSHAGVGQHDGHQPAAGGEQPTARAAKCGLAQAGVTATIQAALTRLDEGRQANSASAMRAAADDAQTALLDVSTRLEPCAALAAASGAHDGHTMPGMPQTAPEAPASTPASDAPAHAH